MTRLKRLQRGYKIIWSNDDEFNTLIMERDLR